MTHKSFKCFCAYQYTCDHCWRWSAKADPCRKKGCKNPKGHAGTCGPFNNTQVIHIADKELR